VKLDFPACLGEDFPDELPLAVDAVRRVIETIVPGPSTGLADQSPQLNAFDWSNYLTCSIARMVHTLQALRRRGVRSGLVLDYGSYFGNASLMLRSADYEVHAADEYRSYGESLSRARTLLTDSEVRVIDFAEINRDLRGLESNTYDAVLFLGVLEHIPHTPRLTLEAVNRVLKPGGVLVLDTPNHAYLANRQKLARGDSVMPNIEFQYLTAGVFEGHHREYTASEVLWMLRQLGHSDISIEMFNYSEYGLPSLAERDLLNHWETMRDPGLREIIMTVSRKGEPRSIASSHSDWRTALFEAEPHLLAAIPEGLGNSPDDAFMKREAFTSALERRIHELEASVRQVQTQVNQRDEMLREQEKRYQAEIQRRDLLIVENEARAQDEIQRRDTRIAELAALSAPWSIRLRRLWRK
jgi:2-polyprenyl-3-methyl-5-hydroxy-6-metoxy-1,4-benzoquinol methylase